VLCVGAHNALIAAGYDVLLPDLKINCEPRSLFFDVNVA
jgi:hypothetical protein